MPLDQPTFYLGTSLLETAGFANTFREFFRDVPLSWEQRLAAHAAIRALVDDTLLGVLFLEPTDDHFVVLSKSGEVTQMRSSATLVRSTSSPEGVFSIHEGSSPEGTYIYFVWSAA